MGRRGEVRRDINSLVNRAYGVPDSVFEFA